MRDGDNNMNEFTVFEHIDVSSILNSTLIIKNSDVARKSDENIDLGLILAIAAFFAILMMFFILFFMQLLFFKTRFQYKRLFLRNSSNK